MVNPWTKKNPFLSMWLSGANAMTGRARSAGAAAASRQHTQLVDQTMRFWTDAWFGTAAAKPTSQTRTKTRTKTQAKSKRKAR